MRYTYLMELFFTPLHIFITTSVAFLFGVLWYSPVLFLKPWLQGEGLTMSKLPKHSKKYIATTHLYGFIAHGALATVLAIIFDLVTVSSLKGALSLGLLIAFGFIVTTRFIDMVYTTKGKHYEMQSQIKFLVSAGYYLAIVAIMSVTLFYLAA